MNEGLTIAQFMITMFGMVGTVGAAIAAWYSADAAKKSLEEQSENNKRAIKPFIVIEEKEFEVEFELKNTNSRHFGLNWENPEYELKDRYNALGSYLNIVNISNGNARDIKVKTVIHGYKQFIDQLNKYGEGITIDIGDHKYIKDSQVIKLDVKTEGLIVLPGSIDFQITNFIDEELLFIKSNGGSNSVRIPDAFLVLYNIYFGCNEKTQLPFNQFPYLIFAITYKDITGKEYDVKYKVRMKKMSIDRKFGSIGDFRKIKFSTAVEQI